MEGEHLPVGNNTFTPPSEPASGQLRHVPPLHLKQLHRRRRQSQKRQYTPGTTKKCTNALYNKNKLCANEICSCPVQPNSRNNELVNDKEKRPRQKKPQVVAACDCLRTKTKLGCRVDSE